MMDAGKLAKRAEVEKHQGHSKQERSQLRWEDRVRRDMRRSGEDERWRGLQIENYGKKEQREWLDNTVTVPDSHPCIAGNKEEKHIKSRTKPHSDKTPLDKTPLGQNPTH